jgi:hypothetical protein
MRLWATSPAKSQPTSAARSSTTSSIRRGNIEAEVIDTDRQQIYLSALRSIAENRWCRFVEISLDSMAFGPSVSVSFGTLSTDQD